MHDGQSHYEHQIAVLLLLSCIQKSENDLLFPSSLLLAFRVVGKFFFFFRTFPFFIVSKTF